MRSRTSGRCGAKGSRIREPSGACPRRRGASARTRQSRARLLKFNTGSISRGAECRTRSHAPRARLKRFELTTGHAAAGSDQGFLQQFFRDQEGLPSLPHAYNVLKRREKKLGKSFRIQDVFVLHLVGAKPWEPGDPGAGEYPLSHGAWHAIRRECGLPDSPTSAVQLRNTRIMIGRLPRRRRRRGAGCCSSSARTSSLTRPARKSCISAFCAANSSPAGGGHAASHAARDANRFAVPPQPP